MFYVLIGQELKRKEELLSLDNVSKSYELFRESALYVESCVWLPHFKKGRR